MLPPAVQKYLDNNRPQMLEKLFELLRFPSVANVHGPNDQCLACADWLARHLGGLDLQAEIVPTGAKPVSHGQTRKPCVVATAHVSDSLPTLLVYGHYDVQPAEPLDLWHTPPFEPAVRDGWIYARGADDDKGQLFTHLCAIEAWQRAGGGVPVNIKVFLEGEEEIGSPDIEPFIASSSRRLKADACLVSDSEFFAPGLPSITYALRGLAYVEIRLSSAAADCHSGIHGGAVGNPLNALSAIVADMHDDAGRVTVPGFYDDVTPLSSEERDEWSKLPFDETQYAASLGLTRLTGGEKDFSVLERRWARPTLDCCGIHGGYTGHGSKTIIPAHAMAKISCRLVSNQDPEKIIKGLKQFVAQRVPPGMKVDVISHTSARPVMLPTHSPVMTAAREAMTEAFGCPTAMIRNGASVPITELFQRVLGLDAIMMGFGLPDDNLHAPNERFALSQLWGGAHASAAFMGNLAKLK